MRERLFLDTLQGTERSEIPFWFMRQAGRYLPEYQKIRREFSNFLEFCYTPNAACEVTLQPIQRFDMDAAILFCDILVIPDALGMNVSFVKGEGPKLTPLRNPDDIKSLSATNLLVHLTPVFEAVRHVRVSLSKDKALIGFAGSPWTLACYMIEGGGSKDFMQTRRFALQYPQAFLELLSLLSDSVARYLIAQIKAGADAVQLFDSWAGIVPACLFEHYILKPNQSIIEQVRLSCPDIPIIGFAKSIGSNLPDFAGLPFTAIGLDSGISPVYAVSQIAEDKVLQGNLDNVLLAEDRQEAVKQTRIILEQFKQRRFIFNLGHGILPHTPISNVEAVIETIKEFSR